MKKKRSEFTQNQKAEIFVRDRATCAFSGISLWMFDNGLKSNWRIDWVDHILPSVKGGSNDLDNGVCASGFFNSKKKTNTSDNLYFVKCGCLTEHYSRVFGTPPKALMEQLSRLKNLEVADWFINRCISNVFEGYLCRCDKEFKGIDYKRTDDYWFNSAWKRLQIFHKKKGASLQERELIKKPMPFGCDKLLLLENIDDENDFYKWVNQNYAAFRESYKALFEYFNIDDNFKRVNYLSKLEGISNLHPDILETLKAHFASLNN